jgi:hypothetical protein
MSAPSAGLDVAAVAEPKGDGKGAGKIVSEPKRVRVETETEVELKDMMKCMMRQMDKLQDNMSTGFTDVRAAQVAADERLKVFAEDLVNFKQTTAEKWAEFDAKIAALDAQYKTRVTDIDTTISAKIKNLEDLLAKNSKNEAGILAGPQADPWAAAAPRTAGSAHNRAVSVPAVLATAELGHDPCKVWVKGFRRPLMREKLVSHFNELVATLPADLRIKAKHNIRGPNAVYSFSFPSPAEASKAYDLLRPVEHEWSDRVTGFVRKLKVYRDQKLEDRNASRIVSKMWEPLRNILTTSGKWKDGMRLLNTSRQLWIVDEDEPFPLIKVVMVSKDSYNLLVEPTTQKYYEIADADVETLKAAAATSDPRSTRE